MTASEIEVGISPNLDIITYRDILTQNEAFPYGVKLKHIKNNTLAISAVFFSQFPSQKPQNKLEKKLPITMSILEKF